MTRRIMISLLVGMLAAAGLAAAIALVFGLASVVYAIIDIMAPAVTGAQRNGIVFAVLMIVAISLTVAFVAFDLLGESER